MIAEQDATRIMNQARIKLAGASDVGIKNELFEVFGEFFDISSAWQETLDMDGHAYQSEYDLVVAEGRIIRLGGAAASMNYPTAAALKSAEAAGTGQSLGLYPVAALMPTVGQLKLLNPSSSDQALRITVVKSVGLPAAKDDFPIGPDWVIPMYGRYIMDGLLGAMMSQPKKSYTDVEMSVYHKKRFQEGIDRARVATLRANTAGAQAWNYPGAFQTRSQKGWMNMGRGV